MWELACSRHNAPMGVLHGVDLGPHQIILLDVCARAGVETWALQEITTPTCTFRETTVGIRV